MKNLKKLFFISLIVLSIIGAGFSSAATINVADGLNNSDIQSIIDNANSGDTIKFLGSEYDNIALVINKTLNLVGADDGTLIKAISNKSYIPSSVNSTVSNTAAFYFVNSTAANSSISGFTITSMANSTSGLAYLNSLIYSGNIPNLRIFNNTLNFSSWGIYAYNSSYVQIYNNTVSNMTTTGILAFGSAEALIANNTVLNCLNHGIDVRHGWGYNATVTGNTINGANEGIYLMHSAGHNVYNNTILNCNLSSITCYGAEDVNIYNNTFQNSFVGIILSSYFENINIQNNTYNLKSTSFPPTFPYYILIGDSSINSKSLASGVFSDTDYIYSNISLTTTYSNSSITNGQTTTYIVKVSNTGNGTATSLNINNLIPDANYTSYTVNAVSRGTFNETTGTWNLDTLNGNSDAIIVITVKANKAGSLTSAPTMNYTDNSGTNTATAQNNSLNINKYVNLTYANLISSDKVAKGKYVYLKTKVTNSGLDTSDPLSVKIYLPSGLKLISASLPSYYNSKTSTWTYNCSAGKTTDFTIKAQVTSKGTKTVAFKVNGTKQTKTITGI